jgi:hypothetical protein
MRAFLAALALAGGLIPSAVGDREGAIHLAQMARDVTDAVRKQRAERRARSHQDHPQSSEGTKR